jgi:hypothetical protein
VVILSKYEHEAAGVPDDRPVNLLSRRRTPKTAAQERIPTEELVVDRLSC